MKKNRFFPLMLVAVMIVGMILTGCKPNSDEESTQGESALKVGLITGLTGLGDKSMNDQALLGCQNAAADFGIEYKVLEPKDTTQVMDYMQNLIDQEYDVIIAAVPDYDTIIEELAPSAPEVSFVTIDSFLQGENIMCVEYLTHLGSYLAGAAAAMKSETGILGCVGGQDLPTISRFIVGFEEGAKSINPDVQVITKYIGTTWEAWSDTTTAKSITLDMVNNGADVVYQIAGGAGLGVIDGCKEAGVWAIGVNVDQEEVAPDTVLTSMLTRGEVAVYEAIQKAVNGEDVSGHFVADLSNEGVGIVYSRHFTQEEITQLKEIREKIISGEITVTDVLES